MPEVTRIHSRHGFILQILILVSLAQLSLSFRSVKRQEAPPRTSPGTYTSYIIGPVCKPWGKVQSPTTEEQVRAIILDAIASNKRVKAFGSRHSRSDIICTDGIAIDMSSFKGIKMNPDNSVTSAAGVTIRELGAFLHSKNRALQMTPAFGDITVGGVLGTGAHGSSLKHESSLSGQAIGFKIVDGFGKIREITDPEQMKAFRIHLGLLGVILEVTFKTVPDFKLTVHNYETSDEILTNGVWESWVRAADFFNFHWYPSTNTVVVSNGSFVPVSTPGDCWTHAIVPSSSARFNSYAVPVIEFTQSINSNFGMRVGERYLQRSLTQLLPYFVPIFTDDGVTLKNPGTGYAYLMMATVCGNDCPWLHYPNDVSALDNEVSLDLKDMASIVRTVKDILRKTPGSFPLQGILLRFSKGSTNHMSTAFGRDTVHFEWLAPQRRNPYDHQMLGLAAYQVMMQALAITYDGRSHWGKSGPHYHNRDMIQRKLNRKSRKAFISQMQAMDPNQIFLNSFGERLLNISEKIDGDPKTKHCALLDNCVCSSDSDCARGQLCGTILGYPKFRACKNNKLFAFSFSKPLVPTLGNFSILARFHSIAAFR